MLIREKIAKEVEAIKISEYLSEPRYVREFPPLQRAIVELIRKG